MVNKRGRKPLPLSERKQRIQIYVHTNIITDNGGLYQFKNKLLKSIYNEKEQTLRSPLMGNQAGQ